LTKSSTPKELYLVIALTLSETLSYHPSILSQVISKGNLSPKVKIIKKKPTNNMKINPQKYTEKRERRDRRAQKKKRDWWRGKVRRRRGESPSLQGSI